MLHFDGLFPGEVVISGAVERVSAMGVSVCGQQRDLVSMMRPEVELAVALRMRGRQPCGLLMEGYRAPFMR